MGRTFTLVRAQDLVVLGVRWSGMDLADGALVAGAGGGRLDVVFPPQHVAEQVEDVGSTPTVVDGREVWRSQLSAPSVVAFTTAPDERIALTVDGVLEACAAAGYERAGTVIELPWRLHVAPGEATWRHSTHPVLSPAGITGLWRTRAADPTEPAELFTIDDGAAQASDPFPLPLSTAARTMLVSHATNDPALARVLELTTLGGSLTASGRWSDLDWDHRAVLGRDVFVHTVARVRMFPFGHPAEIVQLSARVFDAATGTASLRKVTTLQFVDPVASFPTGDAAGRAFPFDRVEVLQPTWTGLPEPTWTFFRRGSGILAELEAQLAEKDGRREMLVPVVAEAMTRDRSVEELAAAGWWEASRWIELRDAMWAIDAELGPAEQAWQDAAPLFDQLTALQNEAEALQRGPMGPEGYDPGTVQRLAEISTEMTYLNQQLAGLPSQQWMQGRRDQRAVFDEEAGRLWRDTLAAALTRDFTIDELVGSGMPEAVELQALDREMPPLRAQVDAERAESLRDHPWYVVPTDAAGVIRFPVRLRGAAGDVDAALPMIAVRDFDLPASGPLPEFHSLTDPQTIAALQQLWTESGSGEVPVDPRRVDLVRAGDAAPESDFAGGRASLPGDVRVVHALSIAGAVVEGGFRPRLTRFALELPEVSTLVGAIAPVPYRYTEEFLAGDLSAGEIGDLVFQTVGDAVDLSFVDDARNAGALLSPRILADGLSRTLGPVSLEGIRSGAAGVFDPSKLFADGATLLGFDLASLVANLRTPPAIVSQILEGRPPRVEMTWRDVALTSFGPFVAGERTRLDLTVVATSDESSVTCEVRDFALALPTPAHELLRLHFGALRYRVSPGSPPSLDVEGLGAEFRGELKLLEALQGSVAIGDNGPVITATQEGISARYSVAVPPVQSGAFALRDIVFRAGVDVPFGAEPPSVAIAFASRERPFRANVLMFGGGGYVDLVLDHRGIRSLEASIEFGAALAVNFLVVEAEVHVLGAIRYAQQGASIALTGYLRMGGCIRILGLVSVSVELVVSLSYTTATNALEGRATLVLELDLTLYSTSVELDTGPWTIAGGERSAPGLDAAEDAGCALSGVDPDLYLDQWHGYRAAFS